MKVTYIVTGLEVAGAETQVKELALSLVRCGHDVEIISLTKPKAYTQELKAAGVSVFDLGMVRERKGFTAFLEAAIRLRRHVSSRRPDIVHSHMVHANLLSRLALAFSGLAPLICTAHSTVEGGALRDWAYRLTNWASSLDTTVSDAATRRFLQAKVFRPDKTITVYNGIDLTRYQPNEMSKDISSSIFRWLAVGRLHESKDYPTLFAALHRVPNATVDIAGQGALLDTLRESACVAGVAGRVRFLGMRNDIPDLLPQYEGFISSSAWEGFGLVVAEAMASGLPVVATRAGGPQEILGDDGAAGFLVPPGDSTSLAEAMQRMMELDSGQRQAMGKAGRMRVAERFGLALITDNWLEIYRRLIAGEAAS